MEMLEQLLDVRNSALWSALTFSNNIEIVCHPDNEYEMSYTPELTTISVDKLRPVPAFFTHELLHLQIKQSTIDVAKTYQDHICHYSLEFLISRKLMAYISNCLEHYLMYPLFLELGYKAAEFTIDYHTRKLDSRDVKQLEQYLKAGPIYKVIAVEAFIGKYFACMNCYNKMHNYTKLLQDMKKLDPGLFTLLENFWHDWKTLDLITSRYDFEETIDIHIEDLKRWSDHKNFK